MMVLPIFYPAQYRRVMGRLIYFLPSIAWWLMLLLSSNGSEHCFLVLVFRIHSPVLCFMIASQLSTMPRCRFSMSVHIKVDFHYIRNAIQVGLVATSHFSTTEQLADFFTKALGACQFLYLRGKLDIHELHAPTWGGRGCLIVYICIINGLLIIESVL